MNIADKSVLNYSGGKLYTLDDQGNPIQVLIFEGNGWDAQLSSNDVDLLLKAMLPNRFNNPSPTTLFTTIHSTPYFERSNSTGTIQLPDPTSFTTPSHSAQEFIEEVAHGLEQYYLAVQVEEGLGLCYNDGQPASTENLFLSVNGEVFVPSDDSGTIIASFCYLEEPNSKLVDLSDVEIKYKNGSYKIEDDSFLIIVTTDGSVIYTDLLDGSYPDEGIMIQDKVITSTRVIKSIRAYYDYQIT